MTRKQRGSGGTAPAAGDREQARKRVYRQARRARRLKEEGRLWMQPHFPPQDSDLAQAWLEGWEDMGDKLAAEAAKGGAA